MTLFAGPRRPLLLKPAAEGDVVDIVAWYDARDPRVAEDFLDHLRDTLRVVEDCPTLYAVIDSDARRAALRRYPYAVIYRIEQDAIRVLAIRHHKTGPARLHPRLT